MLKIVSIGHALPTTFPVDSQACFEPGMIGELKFKGNQVCLGVSNGLHPLGLFDDIKKASQSSLIDEEIVIGPDEIDQIGRHNGNRVTQKDIQTQLKHTLIVPNSVITDYPVILNYKLGKITIPAGSILNHASGGKKIDTIKFAISYLYNDEEDVTDTTITNGRATLFMAHGIWQTDQYDKSQGYSLNATLFCGLDGKLTTKRPTPNHPSVGMVLNPPTATNNMLEFLWEVTRSI